ncbi:MAG: Rieske 2Fe-2S domain-containing protein [Myxococcales bacterium]|nr:Rieske 2Fe-2S domain-containing protein [Myxococcales bacterium]
MQARPLEIRKSLERVRRLPSGGWYVVDASYRIGERPTFYWIDGKEYVAWRSGGTVHMGPNTCPHMGAPLSAGRVRDGKLVCPWHGLALDGGRHGRWEPATVHDDGVLVWIRPGPEEEGVPKPILAPRPANGLSGVLRMMARCDPDDVIANRLDPWHGAWFHPHSFARLKVLSVTEELLTVRVAFRVGGPMCVEVDCTFHCPEPRTIVMTIIDGEGVGSVVETHATSVVPGWSAVVEATIATSERTPFRWLLPGAPLLRPVIEARMKRLWAEDLAYAERTRYLRGAGSPEPFVPTDWTRPPGNPTPR